MNRALIDRNKPMVYLTYKRSQTRATSYRRDLIDLVLLELHNNPPWHIGYVGGPDRFGGSGWFYEVVTYDGGQSPLYPITGNWQDVAGPVGVDPGRSASRIVVQAEHLGRGLAIHASFSFEWEWGPDGVVGEVTHSLRFGYSDLPPEARRSFASIDAIPRPRTTCNMAYGALEPPLVAVRHPELEFPAILMTPVMPPKRNQ